jgi:methylglutaconyl-CoA hydratase
MSKADTTDARQHGEVVVTIEGAVATVRFSHPRSNSLPSALLQRMADEITTIGSRDDIAVMVLRSEGTGAFCAGASFDEMKAVRDAAGGSQFFSGFANVILAMIQAPQLVVTRVHGKVTGGGVGLVAASDYSIAVQDASFKLSELAVGLGPFVIGPVVERKVGRGPFQALSIDADWRDASWGERHGLYAKVVPTIADLDDTLDTLIRFLSQANREAMQRMKRIFWDDTSGWPALLKERAGISGALVLSEHTRAAIAKFDRR